MMREIIYGLPEQIAEAVNFVSDLSFGKKHYDRILICGMGGSGISGEILAVTYPQLQIISNKDYHVPEFINRHTLAILVSYSGNTEETLSNYRELAMRKIDMVLLSSGGALYRKKVLHKIKLPGGLPPRGALGYLFTPLVIMIYQAHLISHDPRHELLQLSAFLAKERNGIENTARRLVKRFIDKLAILYVDSSTFVPVANRWRCQLNENAKVLAHFNVIPEMNHNEIVGIGRPEKISADMLLVLLNDPAAHPRNKLRHQLLKTLVKKHFASVIEVKPQGRNRLQHIFWTILLGDFISYYLALATGVDPMPVTRIEDLKKRMSKVPWPV
jgi:glucose/mannose-6-phosphate isomerase